MKIRELLGELAYNHTLKDIEQTPLMIKNNMIIDFQWEGAI